MPQRQEVLNVLLAQLLQERGLVAAPEQILKQPLRSVSLPDVIVDFQGLRLAIEAEFGMTEQAKEAAYKKARERVEQAIAHVGIAVAYPASLRSVAFARAKAELEKAQLSYAIVTEQAITGPYGQISLFPTPEMRIFATGNVNDLAQSLRNSYEQLVKDETLERAVALLNAAIENSLSALRIQPATASRLARALGMSVNGPGAMSAKEHMAVNRISILIIVNAMLFQEVLSQKDSRVEPLQQFRLRENLISRLRDHWTFILEEINYYPIFYTARELLQCFSADQGVSQAVDNLLDVSLKIVAWRASLRHDLAGRIYHRILEEAKYLGAYYTSIPSAALLLYLALRQDESPYDWSDIGSLEGLRIADLACGTGTLLMAAADMVVDNYIRACVGKAIAPEIEKVHQMIVGKVIYGYDVLPSAVHLTASTLTLRVPDTPINVTHLYRMPLGGGERALGSLNFLETDSPAATLFGQPEQVTGKGFRGGSAAELPALDLCVMNPPFTRSVGGNLLFGNLPEADRKPMQKRLQQIVAEQGLSASITAGLGSVFVGLADRSLKANGRLALVLPRAVLSGVAWKRTRELIESCYTLEYIIVSHEPNHWNFSENTDLSEVLLIAQRRNEAAQGDRVICVNLWRQPANAIEALSLARMVFGTAPPDIASEAGSLQLSVGGKKFGEAVAVEWPALKGGLWSFPCSFAQSEIVRASCHLRAGRLYLPGQGVVGRLPLTPLGNLADLGPDRRDIHDGFELVQGRTSYPAFWNHDSTAVHHLEQTPNQYLSPLSRAKENRPLREATDLWPKAGRVLVAERLRLNTHRLVALRLTRKVLGNVWWPVVLKRGLQDIENAEKALVLWLNSTLGLLLILAYREETEGAWVQFKKPVLGEVPVLDVSTLDRKSLADLASTYDSLAEQSLGSFPEMEWDSTRSAIDEAIARTLGLQDFSILRELLGREPTICLRLERLLGG